MKIKILAVVLCLLFGLFSLSFACDSGKGSKGNDSGQSDSSSGSDSGQSGANSSNDSGQSEQSSDRSGRGSGVSDRSGNTPFTNCTEWGIFFPKCPEEK